MNSIVQLAGIRTAELPAGQIISPDTELLLATLGAIDRRLQALEGQENTGHVHFVVAKDKVHFQTAPTRRLVLSCL